jgi:D-alanyl-D-alanine carboxypeptidase/D-alanyl-D-alanine-endopeptidase (penicillin-binding protein 4)
MKEACRAPAIWPVFALLVLSTASAARGQEPALAPPAAQAPVERSDVARFRQRVEAALSVNGASRGFWGALVVDADTGETLYALNADHYFKPASNIKLFTTAMALATLGPDFRIRTTIETAGMLNRSGRLTGDLVLVGRGDPNLSNRVFPFAKLGERSGPADVALADLADQVVARGVKQVRGDIVVDDSYFVPARFPSGWTVDDTVWSYGAAVSAIAVNDNFLSLTVRPGPLVGAPVVLSWDPWPGPYSVHNEARTVAKDTADAMLELSRDPESRVFRLGGTLAADAPARSLSLAVPEPAELAAAQLKLLLESRGVRVTGSSRARHAPERLQARRNTTVQVLAERISPPLIEDMRLTNKLSQNLHAELMLRVAAREAGGAQTLDDALKFAAQFRESIGIAPEDVLQSDGSGLSRNGLATPRSVAAVLLYAVRQSWGQAFAETLPVAGVDGTMENRMKGTSAAGLVRAKTGTINSAVALSGYATSLRGQRLIFSLFGNNNAGSGRDAAAVLDAICLAMVEELGTETAAPVETQSDRPAELPADSIAPAQEAPAEPIAAPIAEPLSHLP